MATFLYVGLPGSSVLDDGEACAGRVVVAGNTEPVDDVLTKEVKLGARDEADDTKELLAMDDDGAVELVIIEVGVNELAIALLERIVLLVVVVVEEELVVTTALDSSIVELKVVVVEAIKDVVVVEAIEVVVVVVVAGGSDEEVIGATVVLAAVVDSRELVVVCSIELVGLTELVVGGTWAAELVVVGFITDVVVVDFIADVVVVGLATEVVVVFSAKVVVTMGSAEVEVGSFVVEAVGLSEVGVTDSFVPGVCSFSEDVVTGFSVVLLVVLLSAVESADVDAD